MVFWKKLNKKNKKVAQQTTKACDPAEPVVITRYVDTNGNVIKSTEELNSFVLIDIESLSLTDDFMKYQPETRIEKNLKELITKAIESKEKNFYTSIYGPSLIDIKGKLHLSYVPNAYPAVYSSGKGMGYGEEWPDKCYEMAQEYMPEYNSKIGTELQYAAFLGVLIKQLSKKFGTVRAWHYVCRNSKRIGDYYDDNFARTGQNPV